MPVKPPSVKKEVLPVSRVCRVRGFVARVSELRAAFLETPGSEHELLLRAELRRTIDRLSGAFCEAAAVESDETQAAVLRAAALVAHELAGAAEPIAPDH